MESIIQIFNIIYQFITFRYRIIQQMNDEMKGNCVYKDIIQEEMEFYNFYKITGIYMRNTNQRKQYLEFYKNNKKVLDMQFKEFVSAHNYIDINLKENKIKVDLNKNYIHFMGYMIFILTLISYFSLIFIIPLNFIFLLICSVISILFLFKAVELIEPFKNAKIINKTFEIIEN